MLKAYSLHKIDNLINEENRRNHISQPEFLVIIPTHNHPETLEYSILSVLQQNSENFSLVIICDGVSQETREITAKFKEERQVTILDYPKSPRAGEEYRDFVIKSHSSRYVTYLGDDDLFLPNHLQVMSAELLDNDFSHPIPVYVTREKRIALFANTDLGKRDWVNWHMEGPPYKNSISLTGVAHTREIYMQLKEVWSTTPEDRWTDHYMWCKFFSLDEIRLSTAKLSTTIKTPQSLLNQDERREHVSYFFNKLRHESFVNFWNNSVSYELYGI